MFSVFVVFGVVHLGPYSVYNHYNRVRANLAAAYQEEDLQWADDGDNRESATYIVSHRHSRIMRESARSDVSSTLR